MPGTSPGMTVVELVGGAQNYSLWLWVPACAGRWMVSGGRGKLSRPSLLLQTQSVCACERSEAIHREAKQKAGLLRCARNDGGRSVTRPHSRGANASEV